MDNLGDNIGKKAMKMLQGKYVRLRQIEESDLPKLSDWRNSPGIRAYTRGYRPLNMLNQIRWLESLTADQSNIMFAIEGEEVIGCCGLTNINWKEGHGEVSIYIGEGNWQKMGYASDALHLLIEYGFKELRLHRIYGTIFDYNEASVRLFQRNGFAFEGRHRDARFWDGKFYDELVYGILDSEIK